MIAKYISVYICIFVISAGFFAAGSYIFINLAMAMIWMLQQPYGYIAIPFIGYLVLLGGAVAAVGLSGLITMMSILYWIVRNSKEYKKYLQLTSDSAESIGEPGEWLRSCAEHIHGAVRIEETNVKQPKLDTLYFSSRSKHSYSPAFMVDLGGFQTTWMVLENDESECIVARVELERSVPHFIVNSMIESGDLLPNKYVDGNKVNLEGDTNDYFNLTVAGSHESVALEILPPDVLYKLLRNFDEFDLEFRNSHVDIVMNMNQNKDVLAARMRRIEKFLSELRNEIHPASETRNDVYKELLKPRKSISLHTNTVANGTLKFGVRIFPFAFTSLAIYVLWLMLNDNDNAPLGITILYALGGAGIASIIIVVQWTLSTMLFLLGVSVAFYVVHNFVYSIRRQFYGKKYAYYYLMEEMSDSELTNGKAL